MTLVERHGHEHVAEVRLARPEALNALSGAMAEELTGVIAEVSGDRDVWAVMLSAQGERAFCVGADLKERAGFSAQDFERNRRQIGGLFAALRAVPQPTIAAVFGYALGGGFELALSCDLMVCERDAQLGLPETRVGLVPGGGGTQLLARRVGLARAKDVIFHARRIDAATALDWGVAAEVVDGIDATRARALDKAAQLCAQSPVALRAAKKAIDGGFGRPLEEAIGEFEDAAWWEAVRSEDRAEGIAAFNEKRDPRWRGR